MNQQSARSLTWIDIINNSVTFSSLDGIEGKGALTGNNHNFTIWGQCNMWGTASIVIFPRWQQMRVFTFIIFNCKTLKENPLCEWADMTCTHAEFQNVCKVYLILVWFWKINLLLSSVSMKRTPCLNMCSCISMKTAISMSIRFFSGKCL